MFFIFLLTMQRKGTVAKISLRNVGTYKIVEMVPGQNLNLILGPNGTGKSTIVSGIILGLGGNPKTIGRGSQLSDFVKSQCNNAQIDIELHSGDQTPNVVISRLFNRNNQTTWKLNGKTLPFNEIMQVISSFDIQVNNLCQFLPQDRVQDFAKMNNFELLVNTQKSVGPVELSGYHEQLIQLRKKHRELNAQAEKQDIAVKEAEQRNERISGLVRKINKIKALNKQVYYAEAKVNWMVYDFLRTNVDKIGKKRQAAKARLKEVQETAKPIKISIQQAKLNIQKKQDKITELNRFAINAYKTIKDHEEKCEKLNTTILCVKKESQRKIAEDEKRINLISDAKVKSNKLKNDLDAIMDNFGTESAIDSKIDELAPKIKRCDVEIELLNDKRSKKDYTIENMKSEISTIGMEKIRIENVSQKRLEMLRKLDPHAYEGVLWLKDNRHLFKGNIYDPILLTINVTDPINAKYIENIIPFRDLPVFTCEESSDMNLLLQHLRVGKKIRISVVHSGAQHRAFRDYRHPLPIEEITQFGFTGYASTLITGPEPVMKYLCRVAQIHAIPIGSQITNERYNEVPARIGTFFSNSHRYSVLVSRYTKEKSTRITEISAAKFLTISIDHARLNGIQNRIAKCEMSLQQERRQIEEIENQIKDISLTRNALIQHRQQIYSNKDQLLKIRARWNASIQSLRSLEEMHFDVDAEKESCKQQIHKIVLKALKILQQSCRDFQKFQAVLTDGKLAQYKLENERRKVASFAQEEERMKLLVDEAQIIVAEVENQLQAAKKEAEEFLEKAKQSTEGMVPSDDGFSTYHAHFSELPEFENELQELIANIRSQLACISSVDGAVAKEYEARTKLIDTLKDDISKSHAELVNLGSHMEALQNLWLPPLQDLINCINQRFSKLFHKMECAGEVTLIKGPNEHDYDQYGLCIKVSYRGGDEMQELDQYVQSGGERAVATAIYLLAIQELTHVPFRCVDEINQGMDAINERKVFQLIVEATRETNTSQYFLLSPKLLSGLKYVPNMKIHTIHNGPFELESNQYNTKEIMQKKRRSLSMIESQQ